MPHIPSVRDISRGHFYHSYGTLAYLAMPTLTLHCQGPSSQLVPLQQLCPQFLHLSLTASTQIHSPECPPPAKKTRFYKLSKEELDALF